MQCEGIIPAMKAGEMLAGKILEADSPEHRCEAEARTLSRSMREVRCDVGELHWVKDGDDHVYCRRCFVSGTMTHLDGRVTKHPVMAIHEA